MADPKSFAEIVSNTFRAGVTYRRYGQNGELRRPMIHRFPAEKLRCDGSVANTLLVDNLTRTNALLAKLMKRGRNG